MAADWSSLEDKIHARADEIMDLVYVDVLDSCRADAPVSTPTETNTTSGTLRDSLELLETFTADTVHVRSIGSLLDYAQFTDDVDTGAHDIFGNPLLRFWWDGPHGQGIYILPVVHHPGTQGQHWFHDKNLERFQTALTNAAGG